MPYVFNWNVADVSSPNDQLDRTQTIMSRFLKLPQNPNQITTKTPKLSGRILTAAENLIAIKEEQERKQNKKKEIEEKRLIRQQKAEEKRLLKQQKAEERKVQKQKRLKRKNAGNDHVHTMYPLCIHSLYTFEMCHTLLLIDEVEFEEDNELEEDRE